LSARPADQPGILSTVATPEARESELERELELDPKRWIALGIVAGGVSLIVIDSSVVNIALPTMIRDLNLGLSGAEWVNSIYSLVFAATLIVTGRLADVHGRRRIYVTGLAIFAIASILAGIAPTAEFLIFARFLQGIGGALVLPSTLSIVNATFHGKERAAAFGVWGATIGGMAALGPIVGGLMTTNFGWRSIFLINIPFALLLIVLSYKYVRESRDLTAQKTGDIIGPISLGLGLAALIFALIEGRTTGWWTPIEPFSIEGVNWPSSTVSPIPFAIALSLISIVVFLLNSRYRRRAGKLRLVDLELFKLRSFGFGNITALLVSLGEFGVLFAMPLYLQSVLGLSATQSGLLIATLAVGAFSAGIAASAVVKRLGARGVVQLGMTLEVIGITTFALLVEPDTNPWLFVPALFVYGIGIGFSTSQLTGVILSDVPASASGQASGIQSTSRQMGSALGVAILSVILATVVFNQTSANLEAQGLPAAKAASISTTIERSAGTAIPTIVSQPGGEEIAPAIDQAFSDATRWTGLAAAFFVLIGLGSSMFIPKPKNPWT
jgi:EmrB/QacA subfamily drug resistance transporter